VGLRAHLHPALIDLGDDLGPAPSTSRMRCSRIINASAGLINACCNSANGGEVRLIPADARPSNLIPIHPHIQNVRAYYMNGFLVVLKTETNRSRAYGPQCTQLSQACSCSARHQRRNRAGAYVKQPRLRTLFKTAVDVGLLSHTASGQSAARR